MPSREFKLGRGMDSLAKPGATPVESDARMSRATRLGTGGEVWRRPPRESGLAVALRRSTTPDGVGGGWVVPRRPDDGLGDKLERSFFLLPRPPSSSSETSPVFSCPFFRRRGGSGGSRLAQATHSLASSRFSALQKGQKRIQVPEGSLLSFELHRTANYRHVDRRLE